MIGIQYIKEPNRAIYLAYLLNDKMIEVNMFDMKNKTFKSSFYIHNVMCVSVKKNRVYLGNKESNMYYTYNTIYGVEISEV